VIGAFGRVLELRCDYSIDSARPLRAVDNGCMMRASGRRFVPNPLEKTRATHRIIGARD
jgi:hypothetical protein